MKDILTHPIIQGYIQANKFGDLLGMDFSLDKDGVCYKMKVEEKHLATPIASHGGAIAALMDATMGVTALSEVILEGKVVATVEMKLSFLIPALLGDELTGRAKVIRHGKRILFVEGEIKNQDNKRVAFATGTFNAYPSDRAGLKSLSNQ